MKTRMTQKDKNLLIFLFCILIFACFFSFGIRPALSAVSEYREKTAAQEQKQSENSYKIKLYASEQELKSTLDESIKNELLVFYPSMEACDVDAMLEEMADESNLLISSLTIDESGEPVNVEACGTNQTEASDDQLDDDSRYTCVVYASLTLTGSQEDIFAFLDLATGQSPAMRITSFEEAESLDGSGSLTLEINIEIYMQK